MANVVKYQAALYSGLIAAGPFGLEQCRTLGGKDTFDDDVLHAMFISVLLLLIAIIQCLLVIAMTYHHKYYCMVYLDSHRSTYLAMGPGLKRAVYGTLVLLEHWWAVISANLTKFLAGTWYILPLVGEQTFNRWRNQ